MNFWSNVVPFPEFAALKKEVERLRTKLSDRVLERDALVLVECKNIEMAYMLAVGHLEYKAYELQSDVLRYKRKIDMIQAYKNRQETVNLKEIEAQLDREFEMYQEQLEAQMDKINESLQRRDGNALSKEESNELKKLYRVIVKSLHPDLNPEISESELVLFNNAIAAYESGDLSRIRIISTMVKEVELPDSNEDGMAVLVREEKRLLEVLEILSDEIQKIKTEYPYSKRNFVKDEEAVQEKKMELEAVIAQFNDAVIRYKAILRDMLESL